MRRVLKQQAKLIRLLLKDEKAATAIEYGLIAAGIAVVIITAVNLVGTNLTGVFSKAACLIDSPNKVGTC